MVYKQMYIRLLLSGFLVSCSTFFSNPLESQREVQLVKAATVIPQHFSPTMTLDPLVTLQIPEHMLELYKIARPRAEVREGPGITYQLKDFLFLENELLIVFQTIGVWRKVYNINHKKTGWVHSKSISTIDQGKHFVLVDTEKLPTVLAVQPITKIFDYNSMTAKDVRIPKGTLFLTLRQKDGKVLVWLKETNSVAWLSKEIAQ